MKSNENMVQAVMRHFPKDRNFENWLTDQELDVYANSFFKNSFTYNFKLVCPNLL